MADPTIFVVDDDPAVRDAARAVLAAAGYLVEAHESAADFLAAWDGSKSACLLLDVRMPGMTGLELQRRLAAGEPTLPVIMLTGHGDIQMAVDAMKAGAADFLEKPCGDEELIAAVGRALKLGAEDGNARQGDADTSRRLGSLTQRERQVLDLLAAGHSNKGAARELGISPRTVEIHRANLMRKLNVSNIAELVRIALAA